MEFDYGISICIIRTKFTTPFEKELYLVFRHPYKWQWTALGMVNVFFPESDCIICIIML